MAPPAHDEAEFELRRQHHAPQRSAPHKRQQLIKESRGAESHPIIRSPIAFDLVFDFGLLSRLLVFILLARLLPFILVSVMPPRPALFEIEMLVNSSSGDSRLTRRRSSVIPL